MPPILIDLNDVELRLARGTDVAVRSPGYAAFVQGQLELGDRGRAQAWRQPRAASNRYWHTLDATPLTQFGTRVRHAGDLAYLQLAQLRERGGRPERARLLVPGSWQRPQLSLLLGIAKAAGITVEALIDSAVAAGAVLPPGDFVHVEARLHQTTLTHLRVDDNRVTRVRTDVAADSGHVHFEQRAVACVVEAFLKGCRFDPLHDAATEQLLHDHLAQWLSLLEERAEIAIDIEFHGVHHATRLTRQAVCAALAPLWHGLAARTGGNARIVVDYRLARFPGLADTWPAAHALAPDAALRGASESPDAVAPGGDGITLRTSLARVPGVAGFAPPPPAPAPPGTPTHLLAGSRASPLTAAPVYLGLRGNVATDAGPDAFAAVTRDGTGCRLAPLPGRDVLLNGRRVSAPATLAGGDHVSVPGTTVLFVPIEVLDAPGGSGSHVH